MAENEPVWRRLLNGWMAIVGRFGFVQTLLLLLLIYVFMIGPISILMALARKDQLAKRGFGSDGPGARQALLENGVEIAGQPVLVLGSGGAARAVSFDLAHRAQPSVPEAKVTGLQDKLTTLKEEMVRLEALKERMLNAPDKQLSLSDPDSRSMKARGTGIVGYNVQAAVEPEHHLIVAHEVTNVGSDRAQLAAMAERARGAMDTEKLAAVADRGYFSGTQIVDCEEAGITTYVPKPLTSSGRKKGRFTKQHFVYESEHDQ